MIWRRVPWRVPCQAQAADSPTLHCATRCGFETAGSSTLLRTVTSPALGVGGLFVLDSMSGSVSPNARVRACVHRAHRAPSLLRTGRHFELARRSHASHIELSPRERTVRPQHGEGTNAPNSTGRRRRCRCSVRGRRHRRWMRGYRPRCIERRRGRAREPAGHPAVRQRPECPAGAASVLPGRRHGRGAAQAQARVLLRGAVSPERLLHRTPRSRAAVPGAHPRVVHGGRARGRRHHRVRRHLHEGPAAGVPPLAVRPAHDDQHPGRAGAGREVLAAVHPRPIRRPGPRPRRCAARATSRSTSSRACAERWTASTRRRPRRSSSCAARRTSAPICTRPAARS